MPNLRTPQGVSYRADNAQRKYMKKAKTNILCDNIHYVAGRIYTDKEVAHLDPNDFEIVKETKEETPVKIEEKEVKEIKSKKVK